MSQDWTAAAIRRIPLKRLAEVRLGKMLQPMPQSETDEEVPYVRAGTLANFDALGDLPTMWANRADVERYRVRPGDLVVAEGGDIGRVAYVPLVPPNTIIQNSLHRLRPRPGAETRYLKYCLEAIYGSGWLDVVCNRATFAHLTSEKLGSLMIPAQSIARQRAICDLLDAETKRIDALIEKKRRMADLLDDRLRALAVHLTRASDPSARSTPLRRVIDAIKTGGTPAAASGDWFADDGLPWLGPASVGARIEIGEPVRRLGAEACRAGVAPVFPSDSTVLVGIGATAGRVGHLDDAASGNQQLTALSAGDLVVPRFLSWQLWALESELRATAPFSTLPIMSNDFVKALLLYVPTRETQSNVVAALDQERIRVATLVARLNQQTRLLTERRQALITAAVTGTLDLAEAA